MPSAFEYKGACDFFLECSAWAQVANHQVHILLSESRVYTGFGLALPGKQRNGAKVIMGDGVFFF